MASIGRLIFVLYIFIEALENGNLFPKFPKLVTTSPLGKDVISVVMQLKFVLKQRALLKILVLLILLWKYFYGYFPRVVVIEH